MVKWRNGKLIIFVKYFVKWCILGIKKLIKIKKYLYLLNYIFVKLIFFCVKNMYFLYFWMKGIFNLFFKKYWIVIFIFVLIKDRIIKIGKFKLFLCVKNFVYVNVGFFGNGSVIYFNSKLISII